jgi:hypothetical protein
MHRTQFKNARDSTARSRIVKSRCSAAMINQGRASMAWLSVRAESQKIEGAGQGEVRSPFREKRAENSAGCALKITLHADPSCAAA